MGSGGEDDVVAFDRPGSVVGVNLDPAVSGQSAEAFDHFDVALLEQASETVHEAFDGLVLAGEGGRPVHLRLAGVDSELGGVGDGAVHLGDV